MKKKFLVITVLVLLGVASNNSQAATHKLLPSAGPTKSSQFFAAYAQNASDTIKATGTLPDGEPSSPTDARLLQDIMPENLMTHPDGIGTIWWWEVLTAGEGETVALADISMVLSSSDPNNILGKTEAFSGTEVGYSPISPGIRADGSEIISGPANQQAKRVIVGVGSKSFPVSSASSVQTVRNYLNSFPNWTITSMVTAKGATDTLTLALSKAPPRLIAQRSGARFLVIAEDNGDPTSYELQSATSLSSAVWNPAGSISAGQTNDVTSSVQASSAFFIRLAPPIVAE